MKLTSSSVFLYTAMACSIAVFQSCSGDAEGFKTTDSGLKYKFHKEDENGRKPGENDLLWVHMAAHLRTANGDSLLFDSQSIPDYEGGIKFIRVSKPEYKGDLMEGLAMMHLGDSASFIVSADSFLLVSNQLDELPPGVHPGMDMIFHIGVADIQSEQYTMQKIQELQSKYAGQRMAEKERLMKEEPESIESYIKRKNITVKPTESGLYYIETEKGNGPKAKNGQKVTVQYTGYFMNGKKFDSSFDHGRPFEFTLGQGEVIAGWDEGIALMNVGSSATFIVPSQLAYGSSGSGAIPPYSPLIFEVQLMAAK